MRADQSSEAWYVVSVPDPSLLARKPDARTETIEDLVRSARAGRVRVPEFQRGLRWDAQQVLDLFDSVYRGYPIGSLLLFKKRASAAKVQLGPLTIDAPEVVDALWIVDGQQRLTALVASMTRPEPIPTTPTDAFVVYFNPIDRTFAAPPRVGQVPEEWVPATLLLDAAQLSEWVFTWKFASNADLRSALFDAAKRVREYVVPMYVLESDDPPLLRQIFFRINKSGKPLKWSDVYDALYGHDGPHPSTVAQLSKELAKLGMGVLGSDELTSCLLAIRGLDVTRSIAEHRRRDPNVLRSAAIDALPALRQALSFLRLRAAVPHLRLLPRTFVVEVLARFFILHPEPSHRVLELLARWVWRVFLNSSFDERTMRRRSIAAIGDDPEQSVQDLLSLLTHEPIFPQLPDTFDARASLSRLALLGLASLKPRDLISEGHIDVASLIDEKHSDAFRVIIPVRAPAKAYLRGTSNRIIHPGIGSARLTVLKRIERHGPVDPILESHAIPIGAANALRGGHVEQFTAERNMAIAQATHALGRRLAGWDRLDRDRPSIRFLLRRGGGE